MDSTLSLRTRKIERRNERLLPSYKATFRKIRKAGGRKSKSKRDEKRLGNPNERTTPHTGS